MLALASETLAESNGHIAALQCLSMVWKINEPKQYPELETPLYDHVSYQMALLIVMMPPNDWRKNYIEHLAEGLQLKVEELTSSNTMFSRFMNSYRQITKEKGIDWGFPSVAEIKNWKTHGKKIKRQKSLERRQELEKIEKEVEDQDMIFRPRKKGGENDTSLDNFRSNVATVN